MYIKEATQNILSTKLRSFLAILGVLVGVASVVALVISSQSATQHALAEFKKLGTNLMSVSIRGSGKDKPTLSLKQIKNMKHQISGIRDIAPFTQSYGQASFQGVPMNTTTLGVTNEFRKIFKLKLAEGRFVSFLDKKQFYCVIGSKVAKNMRLTGVFQPIGEQIRVDDFIFTVVGVMQPYEGSLFAPYDFNESILVPISASFLLSKDVKVENFVMYLKSEEDAAPVEAATKEKIREMAPDLKPYFITPLEIISGMKSQRGTFTMLLGFIGGIALLVGGIGVMNIMLVSVTERRREIGIRMAVGAKESDILRMFLVETIILTGFGGILGVVLGILLAMAITLAAHWGFHFFWMPPIIGFTVSVVVGLFFGFYPARKAAKLDPIEILRT